MFSSETSEPIEAIFNIELPWDGGTNVCSDCPGHMTNMAAMSISDKKPKKSSSPNQKADDLETWSAVSSTRVLPSLFK